MRIILLKETSIYEIIYPAGSELEVMDFEGEFLISHHRATLAEVKTEAPDQAMINASKKRKKTKKEQANG